MRAGGFSDDETTQSTQPRADRRKHRDADARLSAGQDLAAVLQALEVSEATYHRWQAHYGGMKALEAKRLKELKVENSRLKKLVADQALSIEMLKEIASGSF